MQITKMKRFGATVLPLAAIAASLGLNGVASAAGASQAGVRGVGDSEPAVRDIGRGE